jgi:protein-tyrosine-phosphatase
MDKTNWIYLTEKYPSIPKEKIYYLNGMKEISDPYKKDEKFYAAVYSEIICGLRHLFDDRSNAISGCLNNR